MDVTDEDEMLKDLRYKEMHNAKVQAFLHPIVQASGGFRGGPVLDDPADASLRHTRAGIPVDNLQPNAVYEDRLPGQYIYAGPIINHFGHFMAEVVHRIMPARLRGLRCPYLFVSIANSNAFTTYGDLPGSIKEILAYFEIGAADVKIISRNTIVERLHICESASDLGGGAKPGYLDALREFSTRRLDMLHGSTKRVDKIYVSRSALPPLGCILGETYFEQQLELEGFTIFRPEEMHFTAQMDYYRKARIVIFAEGSACHGIELLGSEMLEKTLLLPRRRQQLTFDRIMRPRSKIFIPITDGCEYLGTATQYRTFETPAVNQGVSWLNLEHAAAILLKAGVARLAGLSKKDYATATEADFERYLHYQTRHNAGSNVVWDQELAEKLKLAFTQKHSDLKVP